MATAHPRPDDSSQSPYLDPRRYSVAWVAPLEIEARAALAVLDERHAGHFPTSRGDDYLYKAGRIAQHNVVIATFSASQEYGTNSAAALASQLKKSFPNLWFALLVGVAAGLPSPARDIRLGDILVALPNGDSPAVVDYQLGKETAQDGFQLLRQGNILAPIPNLVGSAVASLRLDKQRNLAEISQCYDMIRKGDEEFTDPGLDRDVHYTHGEDGTKVAAVRPIRAQKSRTKIWYGTVGSGNKLLKNSAARNALRDKYDLIGLEMEAAGMMNRIPTGVVRGVCDYGDEQKNKEWQPYAAAMAAAYARTVLYEIQHDDRSPLASPLSTSMQHGIKPLVAYDQPAVGKPTAQSISSACLKSLHFSNFNARLNIINSPAPNTTVWIQQDLRYKTWRDWGHHDASRSLLWIKGKPGAGKSTLAKAVLKQLGRERSSTVSFFFNSQGTALQKSPLGMYRSLVYQLAKKDSLVAQALQEFWQDKTDFMGDGDDVSQDSCTWEVEELKSLLKDFFSGTKTSTPVVFVIDGLDECRQDSAEEVDSDVTRQVVYFFEELLQYASTSASSLRVFLTSRSSFKVGAIGPMEIILDHDNQHDLEIYIAARMRNYVNPGNERELDLLKKEVLERSSGIFLWVKLALDKLLAALDGGRSFAYVRQQLDHLPPRLNDIYTEILTTPKADDENLSMTIKMFQWMVFGARPFRMREWSAIFGLIQDKPFTSLVDWQASEAYVSDETQLENRIRSLSRGLVEVSSSYDAEISDIDSVVGGPGSMLSDVGETRFVCFIHTSVIDFMLSDGFAILHKQQNLAAEEVIAGGHLAIANGCMEYLLMPELDALVDARRNAPAGSMAGSMYGIIRHGSVASFHSAASSASSASGDITRPHQWNRASSLERDLTSSVLGFIQGKYQLEDMERRRNVLEYVANHSEPAAPLTADGASPAAIDDKDHSLCEREDGRTNTPAADDQNVLPDSHTTPVSESEAHPLRQQCMSEIHIPAGKSIASSDKVRVLAQGDFTALLDYASSDMLWHANNAELINSRHGTRIVSQLCSQWHRISLLRDDLKRNVKLTQYCIETQLNNLVVPALVEVGSLESVQATFEAACACSNEQVLRNITLRHIQVMADSTGEEHQVRLQEAWMQFLPSIVIDMPAGASSGSQGTCLFWNWFEACKGLEKEGTVDRDKIRKAVNAGMPCALAQACIHLQLDVGRALLVDLDATPTQVFEGLILVDHLLTSAKTWTDKESGFLDLLVARGAELHDTTSLHDLCSDNWLGERPIRDVLRLGAPANKSLRDGETPLHRLCGRILTTTQSHNIAQELDLGKSLLEAWKDSVPQIDEYERAAVALLESGADVNAQTKSLGSSPLHELCSPQRRLFPLVPLLLKHGADFGLRDTKGRQPLYLAYSNSPRFKILMTSWLLDLGATAPVYNSEMKSPLLSEVVLATWDPRNLAQIIKTIDHMISIGFSVNEASTEGVTPLSFLCRGSWSTSRQKRNNKAVVAQTLHSHGADAHLVDNKGKSPLHYAVGNALLGVVKILVDSFGANIEATDTAGNTPLFSALVPYGGFELYQTDMQRERLECIELLIRAGACVHKVNHAGKTLQDVFKETKEAKRYADNQEADIEKMVNEAWPQSGRCCNTSCSQLISQLIEGVSHSQDLPGNAEVGTSGTADVLLNIPDRSNSWEDNPRTKKRRI